MLQNRPLRYLIQPLLIVIILFPAMQHYALSEDKAEPSIGSEIWDFGFLPQKSEVSHTFFLRNRGSSPLTVKKIKTGCSCTSISEIDKPIEPGDSAAVAVTFKSGRYRGPVSKTTKVIIDNPESAIYEFTIKADVLKDDESSRDIKIFPNSLQWSLEDDFPANDSIINISNTGPDTVMISTPHLPGDILQAANIPLFLAPQKNIDIVIKPAAKELLPDIKGLSMTFAFTGKDTTIITVPVKIKKK
ncbi:MAG: DUF1573 domain-containing protein [Candidatus Zixiibacteriota bacterium]